MSSGLPPEEEKNKNISERQGHSCPLAGGIFNWNHIPIKSNFTCGLPVC
jgi:hypothetical protein